MANITKVFLMNVPMEEDYSHTLYFESESAQQSYFNGRKQSKFTFTEFSYQRKDHTIRIPVHVDQLYSADINYCMYQNTQYSNKWFYAFITDMKYINDGLTEVYIKTDCIQTWMFDISIKRSFVEREHCTDDTVGAHTIPEGLETGDYVLNNITPETRLATCKFIMLVTEWSTQSDDKPLAVSMGGIFYAGGAYIFDTMAQVVSIVNEYSNRGKVDAITAVYMCPGAIINNESGTLQYSGQLNPIKLSRSIAKPTSINGYTPRNKKLLTHPYTYLMLANNAGSANVMQYEYFSGDGVCEFEIAGVPVVGTSIKCYPKNYKGIPEAHEEGIMCGKFPTLSWSADLFTNWQTQNGVNIGLGIATGAAQVVGGLATMAFSGGMGSAIGGASIVGGLGKITDTLAQVHTQSFTPNSARGNTNGGDVTTALKMNTFFYYGMSIKAEFAKLIDEYFDMFGYKCNRVKVPAKNHRENYWYTKTIDANITGGIPQEDLKTIKDCYNRGITFWKNPATFRDYGASNNIV